MTSKVRFGLAASVLVTIAVLNRLIAPVDEPFFGGNGIWQDQNFDVSTTVIEAEWIEAAPIVLAENFEPVSVSNIGDRFENGIGFERELVEMYGVDEVDRTANPLTTELKVEDFENAIKFESDTHCTRPDGSKYCDLFIAWDESLTPTGSEANFITVDFGDYQFGIIEQQLFESRSN